MIDLERIQTLFASQQLELTRQQAQQLDQFAQLLVDWNQRMNLTAITDPEEILIKHFLDSVLPFSFLDLPQGCRLIDVGTGAGFPAVPLCIWRPDLQATLLDSLNKRLGWSSCKRCCRLAGCAPSWCTAGRKTAATGQICGNNSMWPPPASWPTCGIWRNIAFPLSNQAGCFARSKGATRTRNWPTPRLPSAFWAAG